MNYEDIARERRRATMTHRLCSDPECLDCQGFPDAPPERTPAAAVWTAPPAPVPEPKPARRVGRARDEAPKRDKHWRASVEAVCVGGCGQLAKVATVGNHVGWCDRCRRRQLMADERARLRDAVRSAGWITVRKPA